MKNLGLIARIAVLATMNFCAVLTSLPSHAQKISIEKAQLVELTKQAEKAKLYEGENINLIVENYKLKEANKKAAEQISDLEKQSKKRLTWAIVIGVIALAGVVWKVAGWLKGW